MKKRYRYLLVWGGILLLTIITTAIALTGPVLIIKHLEPNCVFPPLYIGILGGMLIFVLMFWMSFEIFSASFMSLDFEKKEG